MRLSYGKDENGGSRDLFCDGVKICDQVLSSDAVTIVEALNPLLATLTAERDEARKEARSKSEAAEWFRVAANNTAAERDDERDEARAKLAMAVAAMRRHVAEWGDLAETAIIRDALLALGIDPSKEQGK